MRECDEYEVTIDKLLKLVHHYTEKIVIHVVVGKEGLQDNVREFDLSQNASSSKEEMDRLLKYYADVPVWNLHVGIEDSFVYGLHGRFIVGTVVVNCHYKDIKESYLLEKNDIRRAKRRERAKAKKAQKQ